MEKIPSLLFSLGNLLVCISTAYALLAVGGIHFYSVYFLCAIFWATLVSLQGLRWPSLRAREWALLLLPMMAFLLLCLWRLPVLPVQLDEDMQIGRLLRTKDTFLSAAHGQQPPADYFLNRLAIPLFGQNLIGVRIFSAVFSALSVPLFYLLAMRLCRNHAYALMGTGLLFTSPLVQFYACQARPYALGLFYFLLFLHACLDSMVVPARKLSFTLMARALSFLFTLGLQPVLLVAGAALGGLWVRRKSGWVFPLSLLPALLAFVPIQWGIISGPENHLQKVPEFLSGLPHFLSHLKLVVAALGSLHGIQAFLLVSALGLLFWPKPRKPFEVFLLFVSGALILGMVAAFTLAISSPFYPRYLFLLLPISCLLAILFLFQLEAAISRSGWRQAFRGVVVVLMLALSVAPISGFYKNRAGFEWKRFYSHLLDSGAKGEAFVLTVSPPGLWAPKGFLGLDLYDLDPLKRNVSLPSQWEEEFKRSQKQIVLERLARMDQDSDIFIYSVSHKSDVVWSKLNYPSDFRPDFFLVSWGAEGFRLPRRKGQSARSALVELLRLAEAEASGSASKQVLQDWIADLKSGGKSSN